MLKALTSSTLFTGNEFLTGKAVIINDDRIADVTDNDSIPSEAQIIDCKDLYISPGFIDLQIAGAGGYLFSSAPTPEALAAITQSILKSGTTSFQIVLPTNTTEVYRAAIRTVKDIPHPAVLGLHLEGPYISPRRKGAHMPELIQHPDTDTLEKLLKEADGVIKMITLAPEMCNRETVQLMKKYGVVVCAGHSNATFKEATTGFEWGIQSVTHLFNAMSQMHHRDPGLPGAVFQSKSAYASIIVDGIHVDYNMVSIAKKQMKERLYLVSDAVEENRQGAYQHVRQTDRFTLPDGTLSGSLLSMLLAVRNAVKHVHIPLEEALRMASFYPAMLMKINDRGLIKKDYRADLVVFDGEFELKMVCCNGIFY
jgi:N-acetylglucosamine-6-phosphate deacetylase